MEEIWTWEALYGVIVDVNMLVSVKHDLSEGMPHQ